MILHMKVKLMSNGSQRKQTPAEQCQGSYLSGVHSGKVSNKNASPELRGSLTWGRGQRALTLKKLTVGPRTWRARRRVSCDALLMWLAQTRPMLDVSAFGGVWRGTWAKDANFPLARDVAHTQWRVSCDAPSMLLGHP